MVDAGTVMTNELAHRVSHSADQTDRATFIGAVQWLIGGGGNKRCGLRKQESSGVASRSGFFFWLRHNSEATRNHQVGTNANPRPPPRGT